jgi:hypothetical protein
MWRCGVGSAGNLGCERGFWAGVWLLTTFLCSWAVAADGAAATGESTHAAGGAHLGHETLLPGANPAPRLRLGRRPMGDLTVLPESTRRMGERIQTIVRTTDPRLNSYLSDQKLTLLQAQMLDRSLNELDRLLVQRDYAATLLEAGRNLDALQAYDAYGAAASGTPLMLNPNSYASFLCAKAVCYLRIGEQENCLEGHTQDSCLLPIRGGGVHQLRHGSESAIPLLAQVLVKHPGDLRAQWLLNIAYMTLGEYPDKVPAQWLIDPRVFESEFPLQRFYDVAGAVGLDVNDLAGGVVIEDFDGDDLLDVMVSGWGYSSQLRVFRNNGDGTFAERTKEAGLTGLVSGLNLIHADFNNDGYPDVLVLRGAWLGPAGKYPNSLLRNNGDFTFTDVTEEAGLLSFHPTQAAVWFDYDADGNLDLFIGNESRDKDPNPCELYHNNGDGTFTECAQLCGVDVVDFIKGVVCADYDNDGRPDLFLSSRSGTRWLLHNEGPARDECTRTPQWIFREVSAAAGIDTRHRSFSCWFFDYNNDGWDDLIVTGYAIQDVGDIAADYIGRPATGERARCFRNNRDGTFTDVSTYVGLSRVLHAMGCNFGDLDNDGWLDFYVGTGDPDFTTLIPNRMFRNDGGARFLDVTTAGGFGQIQKGHGIAFADLDNDGDQDIYSVVGGALPADVYRNQLFENPGNPNHWLKLQLIGSQTNRSALGTRIKVTLRTPLGQRAIYRTVSTGGSFGSSPLRQEIGLGNAFSVSRVEIFWPVSGQRQVFTDVEMDRLYRIREGAEKLEPAELARFTFLKATGPHHHPADQVAGVPR